MANAQSTDAPVKPHKEYRMNRPNRGFFLIINQVKFPYGTRKGAIKDAESLSRTFTRLGFKVVSRTDLTKLEVTSVLKEYSGMDHTDMDCFGMAIMSHGEEDKIHCIDYKIEISELTKPFRADNCASLIGKPKLFFFQACRGDQVDGGVKEKTDSDSDSTEKSDGTNLLPIEADNFFFYSTPLGYRAYRDPVDGSWFIQVLCRVLDKRGHQQEFTQLMVRVQGKVASSEYITSSVLDKKKQMPVSVNQLRKPLYFRPKEERRNKAYFWRV